MQFHTFRRSALAAALSLIPAAVFAGDITIEDAYARTSGLMAQSGAAFMVIHNAGAEDDRLVAVRSDIAKKAELHTHIDAGNGIMQMRAVEDGLPIPAGGEHALARGGDHVMFMGLTRPMEPGDTVRITLVFEKAGEVTVDAPVDMERQPGPGAGGKAPAASN